MGKYLTRKLNYPGLQLPQPFQLKGLVILNQMKEDPLAIHGLVFCFFFFPFKGKVHLHLLGRAKRERKSKGENKWEKRKQNLARVKDKELQIRKSVQRAANWRGRRENRIFGINKMIVIL